MLVLYASVQLLTWPAQCRLVRLAADQCSFVRAHCADEQASVFSYLELYYCRLGHVKPVAFVIIVVWLGLLFSTIGIAASDFFCVNLSTIAHLLRMSETMAGVTFLAFGNGSPDVFSTFAAMRTNSGSLAIGELVGAASFIVAVVAGAMALVRPFRVARRTFVRDVAFFTVAVSFSMVFLWDGKLYLWECIAMVAFYVFYVFFVVVWHWWFDRRRGRRQRAAAMRSHYVLPNEDGEEVEAYHDDEDGAEGDGEPGMARGGQLDGGVTESPDHEEPAEVADDDDARERWLRELNSNMRLGRPGTWLRPSPRTPIRPSLVGALEFRAVLASLKKSRSTHSVPLNLRRYSDDPTLAMNRQDARSASLHASSQPSPAGAMPGWNQSTNVPQPRADANAGTGSRARAISIQGLTVPGWSADMSRSTTRGNGQLAARSGSVVRSPASYSSHAEEDGRGQEQRRPEAGLLAPPGGGTAHAGLKQDSPSGSSRLSRRCPLGVETPRPYLDDESGRVLALASLQLPPPSSAYDSSHDGAEADGQGGAAPRWWPSQVFPMAGEVMSTLFPTLYHWKNKSLWEKVLGCVAAPSVFLLTITLPVVDAPKPDSDFSHGMPSGANGGAPSASASRGATRDVPLVVEPSDSLSNDAPGMADGFGEGSESAQGQQNGRVSGAHESDHVADSRRHPDPTRAGDAGEPKAWNRWLVMVQAVAGPYFLATIGWANTAGASRRGLVQAWLWSGLASVCLVGAVMATTRRERAPRWWVLLCFAGFAVSLGWISTIANEVVGVLKTVGVVVDMSDAILGLTVFAVGNSLGDLVADMTVARLGFPVMALSACFGGPMLNMLLGIGLSGCYMTVQRAGHGPLEVEVSTTLVVSGATLLAGLVGLLAAVPARQWKMDRAIGGGLVVLWTASTVANVVVEVTG